jgi:hypothetical protein
MKLMKEFAAKAMCLFQLMAHTSLGRLACPDV